jgi:hypothetical protein
MRRVAALVEVLAIVSLGWLIEGRQAVVELLHLAKDIHLAPSWAEHCRTTATAMP